MAADKSEVWRSLTQTLNVDKAPKIALNTFLEQFC
jgi:hypothetical protein